MLIIRNLMWILSVIHICLWEIAIILGRILGNEPKNSYYYVAIIGLLITCLVAPFVWPREKYPQKQIINNTLKEFRELSKLPYIVLTIILFFSYLLYLAQFKPLNVAGRTITNNYDKTAVSLLLALISSIIYLGYQTWVNIFKSLTKPKKHTIPMLSVILGWNFFWGGNIYMDLLPYLLHDAVSFFIGTFAFWLVIIWLCLISSFGFRRIW